MLASVLALTLGAVLFAQPPKGGGTPPSAADMTERIVGEISDKLTLSSEEEASLKDIFTDFGEQMDAMHKSSSRPEPSKMDELNKERDAKVKEVLSEDKYEEYIKFMEEHMRPPERR